MPSRLAFAIVIFLLALAGVPQSKPLPVSATRPTIKFTDATKSAGINFLNASSPEKRYIVESMSGGVAMFDYDNDGRLDIYLVNSYTVEAALAKKPRPHAALYHNLGDGKFEEVAAKARWS